MSTRPGALRNTTGRGRPYPPELVEAVRDLLLRTDLRFAEIAERTGVGEATVGRWARRFRWRTGRGTAAASPQRPSPRRPGQAKRGHDVAVQAATGAYRRYTPEERDAARLLIEGSRQSVEQIGLQLGIATPTLFRWQKREGWHRPPPQDRIGPRHYRSRRRGRPYGGDAAGIARDLATRTLLSQKRIAALAGVSQATVCNWIRLRVWKRPQAMPGSRRFAAARRTASTAQSGSRRGRPYAPEIVAQVRELYQTTALPTPLIAARCKVTAVTAARWAREKGWTRSRDLPGPDGQLPRRRPKRPRSRRSTNDSPRRVKPRIVLL